MRKTRDMAHETSQDLIRLNYIPVEQNDSTCRNFENSCSKSEAPVSFDITHNDDVGNNPKKWYSINKFMITSKIAYFFVGAQAGSLIAFILIFLKSIGLSSFQAGLINACGFGGIILGNTFWAYIADKKQAHQLVLWIISGLAMISLCFQPIASRMFGNSKYNTCPLSEIQKANISNSTNIVWETSLVSNNGLVAVMASLNFLGFFCDGSILSLTDAAVTRKIIAAPSKIDYGIQRVFNSIGYGTGSLASSALLEISPSMSVSCYTFIYCVYALCLIPGLFVTNALYKDLSTMKPVTTEKIITADKNSSWKEIKRLDVMLFFATSFLIGALYGANLSYTMLYAKQLHAPDLLIGLIQVTSSLSAIIVYTVSLKFIMILRGYWNTVCICFLVWIVRFSALLVIKNPWIILPLELLHGISVSLYIAARAKFIQELACPSICATLYGINHAMMQGAGPIVANVIGGLIYDYSPRYFFGLFVLVSAIWLLILFTIQLFKKI